MPESLQQIAARMRENVTQQLSQLDALSVAIDAATGTTAPVRVRVGDNLQSLVNAGAAGTVYELPLEMTLGDLQIDKPCTLRAVASALPAGRVGLNLVGPMVSGAILVNAPDVTLRALRQTGRNRDGNLLIVSPKAERLTLDQVLMLGGESGQKRGIYLEARDCTVRASHIGNVVYQGNGDTQAIASERGAHNLLVDDCFLEAAGEVVIFGGGDIGAESLLCTGLTFRNTTMSKRVAWRATKGVAKNIFELKAARRVRLESCLLEHSWVDGQIGFGIVLTVRNQYNRDPYATIEDVEIVDTTVRGCAGGVSILGRDDTIMRGPNNAIVPATGQIGPNPGDLHQSGRMQRVAFRNLRIEDISRHTWGWNGRTTQILGGPRDLLFDGLTVVRGEHLAGSDGRGENQHAVAGAMFFDRPAHPSFGMTEGLVVRNAVLEEGEYGIHSPTAIGVGALETYAPGYQWEGVQVKKGGARFIKWPTGTVLV